LTSDGGSLESLQRVRKRASSRRLGGRLGQARRKRGYTQAEAAALLREASQGELRTTQQTISRWERNVFKPMTNELEWICIAYGIRFEWLVDKKGAMDRKGLDISQFHHPDLK